MNRHVSGVCHFLTVNLSTKSMEQRKWKVWKNNRSSIDEEVGKMPSVGFITNTKYPTYLANMVLVRKVAYNWHMCLDFTDLNAIFPKDSYPISDINILIDVSSSYRRLSFIDSYSVYNNIRVDALDASKRAFLSNNGKYYYNVIPFGLNNDDTTYKRLMSCSPIRYGETWRFMLMTW